MDASPMRSWFDTKLTNRPSAEMSTCMSPWPPPAPVISVPSARRLTRVVARFADRARTRLASHWYRRPRGLRRGRTEYGIAAARGELEIDDTSARLRARRCLVDRRGHAGGEIAHVGMAHLGARIGESRDEVGAIAGEGDQIAIGGEAGHRAAVVSRGAARRAAGERGGGDGRRRRHRHRRRRSWWFHRLAPAR